MSRIDRFFLIASGVASLWMAYFLLTRALSYGWLSVLQFIPIWGAVSYLTLPRLNKIIADIYVPHYFMGRTQTSDGLLGDPVNLAFRGSAAQLHAALRRAGWHLAEPVTARTSWKIIWSTLRKKEYLTAPVSPLVLFDRIQDFAYQQPVVGAASERHHVRFWKCDDDWRLPGGEHVEWLAASTFDKAVGVSIFTLQVTHHIAEDTDRERDHLALSLEQASPEITSHVLENFAAGYHSRNGGGDQIKTDGHLPILDLHEISPEEQDTARAERTLRTYEAHKTAAEMDRLTLEDLKEASPFNAQARSDRSEDTLQSLLNRPFQVFLGTLFIVLGGLLGLAKIGTDLLRWDDFSSDLALGPLLSAWAEGDPADARTGLAAGLLAAMGVLIVLTLILLWMMSRGAQAARLLLLLLTLLSIGLSAYEYYSSGGSSFLLTAVHVILLTGGLVELSGPEASRYVMIRRLARADRE